MTDVQNGSLISIILPIYGEEIYLNDIINCVKKFALSGSVEKSYGVENAVAVLLVILCLYGVALKFRHGLIKKRLSFSWIFRLYVRKYPVLEQIVVGINI